MPRTMEKIIPVRISTDEINCYATIQRSCLAGIAALLRIAKSNEASKGKHLNPQITKLRELKHWAEGQYDSLVDDEVNDCGNPAEG